MRLDPLTGLYVTKDGLLFKCVGRIREPAKRRLQQVNTEDTHGYERYKGTIPQFVHRIVFRAFIGDIPEGLQIDHIDGNKKNNSVNNLQLLSPSANTKKAWEQGFAKSNTGCFNAGSKPWNAGVKGGNYMKHYKHGFKNQFSKEAV